MARLLVIKDSGRGDEPVPSGVEKVLSHWRGLGRPRVTVAMLADVLNKPEQLDDAEAVWMLLDRVTVNDMFNIIGEVEERHLPALLTRPNGSEMLGQPHQEGIVACPPGTDPIHACAVLQTLLSQAPTLATLKRDVRVLQAQHRGLCDQIGKLDEELRMAAQLQREFLPTTTPTLNDVSFHVLYRPAGYVSGDIYDVTRLDDHHVGFFVADAVGHGVPAALMTVFIKRSLRTKRLVTHTAQGYELIAPGEALARLNEDMIRQQSGKVRFATACYGIIDTRDYTMTIARAGHPFPMILKADGEVQTLEPEGGLLGVFPNEVFHEQTVQLEPGDRMLVYSDGFECAFPDENLQSNGKRRVSNENYAREFLDLGNGDPAAAIKRLEDNLDTQAGSLNQKDDLTVLCMSVAKDAEVVHVHRGGKSVAA